ncbi:MAG TPA: carboxypeptidase M32 [Steroidobacteraceae bacterium]|nr:carboxypeptidase M32 [Steroidobacteraceae bacterium]
MSAPPYKQLEQEFKRLHAFRGAISLLSWDASVMMPRGSAALRGEQLAALETEYHTLLTAPKITRLLDRAHANTQSLDDWQVANLREMRRQRDHAIATPGNLVSRMARATAQAEAHWLLARAEGRFEIFAPHLEEVVMLVRDKAALLGQALNLSPYDALIDEFSPGISSSDIDGVFRTISRRLPSLIREVIGMQEAHPPLPLEGKFTPARQRALVTEIIRSMGFSFEQGRLDESEHPFTEGVPGDMRLTTRYDPADVFTGLLSAIHETGHAMYHMGLPAHWRDQPVGRDRGMVAQESQSLLLERLVCRSRAFAHYLSPLLVRHFGVSGPAWDPENLYAHLTRVRRGAIRVDADELTYPLHVLVRYELEKRLLSGELAVRDLPEAWNAEMEQRLGFHPDNDRDGCLQDIHWADGSFGYFPSYALGAVIAVQFMESLRNEVHDLDEQIARGEFGGLFGWLRTHVHSQGARLTLQELLQQATGKTLSAAPFMRYLENKYLEAGTASSAAA